LNAAGDDDATADGFAAPVGFVIDRLRKPGFAPRLPECREWPVIDMDGDRLVGLGVDADQADDSCSYYAYASTALSISARSS
jgi:hypothetical protein